MKAFVFFHPGEVRESPMSAKGQANWKHPLDSITDYRFENPEL
jgi:hypothetical protein